MLLQFISMLLLATATSGLAIDELPAVLNVELPKDKSTVPDASDVVIRCGDCLEWQVSKAKQSKFGQQLPNNLSVTQCQRACVLNIDCVGFDYDRSSSPCWLHLATDDFNEIYPVATSEVDQYRLSRKCKTSSDAGMVCEKIYETCVNGANYYKSACLEQASSDNQNLNGFLENELIDLCQAACRDNEDCVKDCELIKSKGLIVSSQQYDNAAATCNANFDRRKNDCNANFLTCL